MAPEVATRTHLSIGEVLALLQESFPDLTITKIRFLESQGLINPERTPSGYRKFYEFDIERLRWILRQQREHFLPLKVIKGRLDGADGNVANGAEDGPEQAQLTLAPDSSKSDPPPVWMADHARATAESTTTTASSPAQAKAPAATPPVVAAEPTPDPTPAPAAKPPVASAPVAKPHKAASPPPPTHASTVKSAPVIPPKATPGAKHDASATKEATMPPSNKAVAASRPLDLGVSGISMSLPELAKATGLSDSQLEELEDFGLIESDKAGPEPIYAEEALVVARHAKVFFDLGVQARHLRGFKVAADREAGLLEQLILPLLKQRNPQARQEAIDNLERLATAGDAMHGALLHLALRPHLGRKA